MTSLTRTHFTDPEEHGPEKDIFGLVSIEAGHTAPMLSLLMMLLGETRLSVACNHDLTGDVLVRSSVVSSVI